MAGAEIVTTGPLYGTFSVQSVNIVVPDRSLVYRDGYLWDFDKGDFSLDGQGRTIRCNGYVAWALWCLKTCLTERYAHPIYSNQFGTEMEPVVRFSSRTAAEAHIIRTITEALRRDSRTSSVHTFTFEWESDSVEVLFTIVPTIGTPLSINITTGVGA